MLLKQHRVFSLIKDVSFFLPASLFASRMMEYSWTLWQKPCLTHFCPFFFFFMTQARWYHRELSGFSSLLGSGFHCCTHPNPWRGWKSLEVAPKTASIVFLATLFAQNATGIHPADDISNFGPLCLWINGVSEGKVTNYRSGSHGQDISKGCSEWWVKETADEWRD